jgi:glutathione S-transferase
VRLCFEEAAVPYLDVARAFAAPAPSWTDEGAIRSHPGFKAVIEFCFANAADDTHAPLRAPPAVARGWFAMCNTPAICSYLNEEFGWGQGLTREQKAGVDQILSVVLSDAVGEGRLGERDARARTLALGCWGS